MDPCLVGITDSSPEACWIFCSESVSELLGFEPRDLINQSSMNLVHPDELMKVRSLHDASIRENKAATISYMRMRHKDAFKGYILCSVMRTIVSDVVVGSVSFAEPGAKMERNDSTAQEVSFITPMAENFQFRKWSQPSPWSNQESNQEAENSSSAVSSNEIYSQSEDHKTITTSLISPLPRVALILDRFSSSCPILFSTSKSFFSDEVKGFSLFDFVTKGDEELVRQWITQVKTWGVNEHGQPSDGGFGFGRFKLCRTRRESRRSSVTRADRISNRKPTSGVSAGGMTRTQASRSDRTRRNQQVKPYGDELIVEAIFSAHSDGLVVILCPIS